MLLFFLGFFTALLPSAVIFALMIWRYCEGDSEERVRYRKKLKSSHLERRT